MDSIFNLGLQTFCLFLADLSVFAEINPVYCLDCQRLKLYGAF